MERLRRILVCLLLAVLVGAVGFIGYRTCNLLNAATATMKAATATVAAVPGEIAATRGAVVSIGEGLSKTVDARTAEALGVVDRRTGDALARVDALTVEAHGQLTTLNQTVATLSARTSDTVSGLRADIAPVFQETHDAVKDVHDSLDDLYPDIKGGVASGVVAVTGVAYASEAMGKAAPVIAESVAAVSADVRREADELTKPKTMRQKVSDWLSILPKLIKFVL